MATAVKAVAAAAQVMATASQVVVPAVWRCLSRNLQILTTMSIQAGTAGARRAIRATNRMMASPLPPPASSQPAPAQGAPRTPTLTEIAASTPEYKNTKKKSVVMVLHQNLNRKRQAERTGREEGKTSAIKVRQTLVNMMNAYAQKAR